MSWGHHGRGDHGAGPVGDRRMGDHNQQTWATSVVHLDAFAVRNDARGRSRRVLLRSRWEMMPVDVLGAF